MTIRRASYIVHATLVERGAGEYLGVLYSFDQPPKGKPMAGFSTAEKALLRKIPETSPLRTNLSQIREGMEKIWATEAPRVVQDFTDHGTKHCERLAEWAVELLKGHSGKKLTAEETYLLLAGIYLHDIGMQCDVVRFPQIKARAEELGAKFDLEFTSLGSNNYKKGEQNEIRRNHHYLSIAWIAVARETAENMLHTAAREIPEELLLDLQDVCVHHTKLAIGDCDVGFTLDQTGRKRFVAALLRFSDELDIESTRVEIETVTTFSIDPANSVYWWLHHNTKVTFPATNLVNVSVRLHADDFRHSSLIQNTYISDFRTKNLPVLSVLAQNSLPIVIDAESKVIEYEATKSLPDEIRTALKQLEKRPDPLSELVSEIGVWLRSTRYEVGEPYVSKDGRSTDLIATIQQGTINQRVLVRCIGGEVTPADVRELDNKLDRKTNQGWIISDKRVSDEARRVSTETDVEAFTLSDFLRQKVWGSYIDSLTSLVEGENIPDLYVDIGCYKQTLDEKSNETKREEYESLDGAIDEWLSERGKMHVSLLGEFGSGKTWFCRHYAYTRLKAYLANPATERLPLLITLRNFTKATSARELINDALTEQYQAQFVGAPYEVFEELNRRGKILLILDGFDEMARKVDKQTVVDNFWELATLVDDNSKVILTSRTEYFRWSEEAEKILAGEELGKRIAALKPPKFEVFYLQPFTDEQIRTVIKGRLQGDPQRADQLAKQVLNSHNLKEMARKPVLVELLLAAIEDTGGDLLANQALVYLYATNKLILRNIDTKRTFTTTADKLFFLCELAWKMIESGELRIHYKDLPNRIQHHFSEKIKDAHELDHWEYDLRNQTLLRPDLSGYYEFSHKSLAEYFVAFKFAAELGCLSKPFTETYREEGDQPCHLPYEKKTPEAWLRSIGARSLSINEMTAVRAFMGTMITSTEADLLRASLRLTAAYEEKQWVSSNIATLLSDAGELHPYRDFSGIDLEGSVLRLSQIWNADLRESGGTIMIWDDTRDEPDRGDGGGWITAACIYTGSAAIEGAGWRAYGIEGGKKAVVSRPTRTKKWAKLNRGTKGKAIQWWWVGELLPSPASLLPPDASRK